MIYQRFSRLRDHFIFWLARQCGIVPSSFFVKGVDRVEDKPIGHGGFADVYKGRMQGVGCDIFVAIKTIRPFGGSGVRKDVGTLRKASCPR